jgi:DNA-3-methyladenine glycosylase I
MTERIRCGWAAGSSELMQQYHDKEWGKPSRKDDYLFELLILEGAQAGLSWSTVLNKREGYREVFADFDYVKLAKFTDAKLEKILESGTIVRNRLKVWSVRTNAQAFLQTQKEFGTFANFLWGWVDNTPIVNHPNARKPVQATTELSDKISKDLKKRGFTFIGSTIVYAYLQATGVVDDHEDDCFAKRTS